MEFDLIKDIKQSENKPKDDFEEYMWMADEDVEAEEKMFEAELQRMEQHYLEKMYNCLGGDQPINNPQSNIQPRSKLDQGDMPANVRISQVSSFDMKLIKSSLPAEKSTLNPDAKEFIPGKK